MMRKDECIQTNDENFNKKVNVILNK